jgi:hypothetical protein
VGVEIELARLVYRSFLCIVTLFLYSYPFHSLLFSLFTLVTLYKYFGAPSRVCPLPTGIPLVYRTRIAFFLQ